jgi:hypothetical protein
MWTSPKPGLLRDYDQNRSAARRFGSLAELRTATGQEAHGTEVDYDVFENLRPPDADKPHAVYHARNLNFQLKANGKAIDAGVRLSNVNDEFTGKSPDLGAYELGGPVPSYGPRTTRVSE